MSPSVNRARAPARRLILASSSPRRASLMREYGYDFEVITPPLGEPGESARDISPAEQAQAYSYFKARSVAADVDDGWILAGDTVVSLGGRIFGKPADRDQARRILAALSGTTHEVITAVTLLDASTPRRLVRHDVTAVTFKTISEVQIEAYLDTGAWAGKAGAYGIQDRADAFVDRIEGSFTNVVGFPMELVALMLRQWGMPTPARPTQAIP